MYVSPRSMAVVDSDVRSDPASGSVILTDTLRSPLHTPGMIDFFCSCVPKISIARTGPTFDSNTGAAIMGLNFANSSMVIIASIAGLPPPPYSGDNVMPRSPSSHTFSSVVGEFPVLSTCVASSLKFSRFPIVRRVSTIISCSFVKLKSISVPFPVSVRLISLAFRSYPGDPYRVLCRLPYQPVPFPLHRQNISLYRRSPSHSSDHGDLPSGYQSV